MSWFKNVFSFFKKKKDAKEANEDPKFSISVMMTEGCLIGKKIKIYGVAESTTLRQFMQILASKLEFSFLIGSLWSELFGCFDFMLKDEKCTVLPNGDKSVVEATLYGSANLTCVISQTSDINDDDFDEFCIFVKTIDYKTITLPVGRFQTVRSLKLKIGSKLRMPVNYCNFSFNGKSLDDSRTLEYYEINEGCTLQMVMRLAGGGGMDELTFIDVDSDKTIDLRVVTNAPDWRKFCKGLTMEGICKNSGCVAHEKRVLSCQRYGAYNLGKDLVRCPMCEKEIKPIRPIFYKCVVVYYFMKKDGSKCQLAPKEFDKPQTYDEKEAGMREYRYLMIQVNRPNTMINDPQTRTFTVAPEICNLCHKELTKDLAVFPGFCGHMVHQECVDKWIKVNGACPACSANFSGI